MLNTRSGTAYRVSPTGKAHASVNAAFTYKHQQRSHPIRRGALAGVHLLASGGAERDARRTNVTMGC